MRSRNTVPGSQLYAWLFAAVSAPLAQIAGGCSWYWALLIGGACMLACLGVSCLQGGDGNWPVWLCAAQWLWMTAALISAAGWTAGSWQSGNAYPAVPVTLLLLAAVGTDSGAEKTSRIGSVLFWILVLLYSGLLFAGIKEIRLWDAVTGDYGKDYRLIPVFLIPAVSVFLPGGEKRIPIRVLTGILGFGIMLSVWVAGGLPRQAAMEAVSPFYEWVRGLTGIGVAKRFEALASVGLSMGWFAGFSFLLSAAGEMAERVVSGKGRTGIWAATVAAIAGILLNIRIPNGLTAVACVVFWILLPAVCALFEIIKRRKTRLDKGNIQC